MPFSTTTDANIYYELHGEHGAPLLMIHGLGASKATWAPSFIGRLSAHHRVIIFDNRGTGQSDKPDTPYTMAQMAADAVGILDTLKIEKAHVLGISLGGAMAQQVALDHRARVDRLILMCTLFSTTGHPNAVRPAREVLERLVKPATADRAQDSRDQWPIMYPSAFVEQKHAWLEERLQTTLALDYPRTPDYAVQRQVRMPHDTYDQLPQITQPTLVQTGTADIIIPPENSRIIAERIPNAQLREYPDSGHLFQVQFEAAVAADILAFLAE